MNLTIIGDTVLLDSIAVSKGKLGKSRMNADRFDDQPFLLKFFMQQNFAYLTRQVVGSRHIRPLLHNFTTWQVKLAKIEAAMKCKTF